MSLWAFRCMLWYICIMFVQPQNRFAFLWPLRIANVAFILTVALHIFSCLEKNQPFIRLRPATILALLLIFFAFVSQHFGLYQVSSAWNSYLDIIVKNALLVILLEPMLTSIERVWAVQMTMLFSTLWWIKGGVRLAQAGATYAGDRLMGAAVSMIENPNGFAYMLCVFLPFYLYAYQQATKTWIRYSFLAVVIAALYIIFETGSRTGIVVLVAIGIFLVWRYLRYHIRGALIITIGIICILPLTGERNIQRFKTIPDSVLTFFGKEDEKPEYLMTQDEQSAFERRMKNKYTWVLIKDHPVFGVGVNPNAQQYISRYPYTSGQVHSEVLMAGRQMGFIGMGLYFGFIWCALWGGYRIRKEVKDWPAVADLGWTFQIQALAILVGGFFSPYAWHPPMMILAASASSAWMLLNEKKHQEWLSVVS